jgi:aminotransferase
VTPQQIDEARGRVCAASCLDYPCNPTGTSYSKKELEAIARVIKKHDMLVISDELYDELTYDFEHTPMATLPQMQERTIYLNGFSKSYAMTVFASAMPAARGHCGGHDQDPSVHHVMRAYHRPDGGH